jgi:uncharacterized glyoxalase superfamily protein PhnB
MTQTSDVAVTGLSSYLYYEDAGAALSWLSAVLGLTETVRFEDADGIVREAEMTAGPVRVMLSGRGAGYWAGEGLAGPAGQLTVLHVDDVDAHHRRAVAAGATADGPANTSYGERAYSVTDPEGHQWYVWQHLSDEVELAPGEREIRG